MKKFLTVITVLLSLTMGAAALTGCGVQIDENGDMIFVTEERNLLNEGEPESIAEEVVFDNPVIGEPSSESTVRRITLLNMTGADIESVQIKAEDEEEFGENLLPSGETFLAEEVRDLFYDLAPKMSKGSDLSGLKLDIKMTTKDGEELVLHAFPIFDMEQGRICLQDGVPFLEYVSYWTGEEVLTRKAEAEILEAERIAKEQAEAERKAAEEAEAKRIAEEQAALAAQQELAAQQWAAQQQWQAQQEWQAQQQWVPQQTYSEPAQSSDAGCINDSSLVY